MLKVAERQACRMSTSRELRQVSASRSVANQHLCLIGIEQLRAIKPAIGSPVAKPFRGGRLMLNADKLVAALGRHLSAGVQAHWNG